MHTIDFLLRSPDHWLVIELFDSLDYASEFFLPNLELNFELQIRYDFDRNSLHDCLNKGQIVPQNCEENANHKSTVKNWKGVLKMVRAHIFTEVNFLLIICPNICGSWRWRRRRQTRRLCKSFAIEIESDIFTQMHRVLPSRYTLPSVQMLVYDVNKLCLLYVCSLVHGAHLHFKVTFTL